MLNKSVQDYSKLLNSSNSDININPLRNSMSSSDITFDGLIYIKIK